MIQLVPRYQSPPQPLTNAQRLANWLAVYSVFGRPQYAHKTAQGAK